MKRVKIQTLGCKVNQCESSALRTMLDSAGFETDAQQEQAGVVVINTCTVTGKAAMQSRQAIRRAMRDHPKARIVVTGCYAQTAPDEIQAIDGVNLVVGHADKLRIADLLSQCHPNHTTPVVVHQPTGKLRKFASMPSVAPDDRTRAFLKIQDGCDAFCSYCIVPHARGRSRSMPNKEVHQHLEALASLGYREAVLTGIHLGAYGKDLDPPCTLADLLSGMQTDKLPERLRLSSIEPTEIDDTILQHMADKESPVCPHLHVPMQSGDDKVLARMRRPYTRDLFGRVIRQAKDALPQASIGVDVLVGFPGESDHAFNQTVSLVKALPISYLHVFPFSVRKGTPAAAFKDKVPDHTIKERCEHLRHIGEEKKHIFYQSQVGQKVEVLVETEKDTQTGQPRGHTANYLPVVIAEAKTAIAANTIVPVRIDRLNRHGHLIGHCLH